jgi:uncharacterized protein YbaP (TraB family)
VLWAVAAAAVAWLCVTAPALAAPGTAQSRVPTPAADAAPAPAPAPLAPRRACLWQVSSPTATNCLLGSIHFARKDLYPLAPQIEAAFASASILVVEADVARSKSPEVAAELLSIGFYPEGDGLAEHLSGAALEVAAEQLRGYGLSLSNFMTFKPWFLAFNLVGLELKKLGITPEHGIDLHFLERAGDKQVVELESAREQLALLDSFTDREQELFLLSTFKDLKLLGAHMDQMLGAWAQGDAARLEEFLLRTLRDEPKLKSVYRKLLFDRNKRMARKIEGFLRGRETRLVVVGAAHLLGQDGVLDLLRRAGYRVDQR